MSCRTAGRWVAALLCSATALGGCARDPELVQPSANASVAAHCARVMAALPHNLLNQSRISLDGGVATWGKPRISLRCGVERPAALQPTSRCDVINDIGWFAEDPGTALRSSWRFTTIGRVGYIEVIVPERYQPAADALVELTDAVAAMPVLKPCQ